MNDVLEDKSILPEASLVKALNQSEQVKRKVESCAHELALVNTVLKEELEDHLSLDDIQTALAQSEEIEDKVQECAEDLHTINTTIAKEIKERKKLEQKLSVSEAEEAKARYLAYHDVTTGLANRALFNARLDHALVQAERHDWTLAILFIDLNKFKAINDTYGHDIGDMVLQTVGERLKASVRDEDTVSRIGGDEFMCLLLEVKEAENVENIVLTISAKISDEFEINGIPLSVESSIGIALYPQDGTTAEALLKNADTAMFEAKQNNEAFAFSRPSTFTE